MKRLIPIAPVFTSLIVPCLAQEKGATAADRLYAYSVNTSQHATDQYMTSLGPTGARGWVYMNRIYIHDVEAGSPADGLLHKDDYLLGAGGQIFSAKDPRPTLGYAIDRAEAANGKLLLNVGNKGKERVVTVQLKPIGGRSATWPYDCKKSTVIRERALRWLREHQRSNGGFGSSVFSSLDGLLLLSSPAPEDQEAARRCIYNRFDGDPSGDGYNAWGYGYSAMVLSEYYLATGDSVVLPRLKFYAKEIAAGQTRCGSWCHGMVQGGVPGGYGELNQAGVMCFLSLVMIRECGIDVDREALGMARYFFGRYAGLGCIPYGDNRPWDKWPSSTGKDSIAALAFRLLGEQEKMRAFAESVCLETDFIEDAHTGAFWGATWLSIGASMAKDATFHKFINNLTWYYELERRWDGGFKYLPNPENLTGITGFEGDAMTVTGGFGLIYALPLKSLLILGREVGPFGKNVAPALKPAVALFNEKKWDAFDVWMRDWQKGKTGSNAEQLQAKQLLAMRASFQAQVDWTLSAVEKMAAKEGLTRLENERAKEMLKAAERLAGREQEKAQQLRTRLAAIKELPAVQVVEKKREASHDWKHLLPLAQDLAKDAAPKSWRVHAWTGDIVPALDNLEPAGESMKGWYLPQFDDSKWQAKTAPFRAHNSYRDAQYEGQTSSPVSHHDCMYQPRPLYNTIARHEFTVDSLDGIKSARIVQQNCHQYLRTEFYLNGYRVAAILRPKACELSPEALKLLRKGKNTLAVYITSCRGHLHDFDFGLDVAKE
jgi:hypothetical protein